MEQKKHNTTAKSRELKPVLSPRQFFSQKFPGRNVEIPQTEVAGLMVEYLNYRTERAQLKPNKYAESIGILKAVISLVEADQLEAAAMVLKNCGFNSLTLVSRLANVAEYEKYKTPKKITSIIRQTLDPDNFHKQYNMVKDTENGYVILEGIPCPAVTIDKDSSVLCPFCHERHTHKYRENAIASSKLPNAHFSLPCMAKHHLPLEMFDGTICRAKDGYYIENFEMMKNKTYRKAKKA